MRPAGFMAAVLLLWVVGCGEPSPPPLELRVVDLETVREAVESGDSLVIDARPEIQYLLGHIPGAENLPYDSPDIHEIVERWSLHRRQIVVYCSGRYCDAAERLADALTESGCRDVAIFSGGWEEWSSTVAHQVCSACESDRDAS